MSDTMLAARLNLRTRAFAVEETPIPQPGPGQVRIKVAAAGICLSDVHFIDGDLSGTTITHDKVTLGHEVSGTVDTVGAGVPTAWTPGTRVLLQGGNHCGRCAECVRGRSTCGNIQIRGVHFDGGMAEYALANHTDLVAIPDDLPFEQAAIIPDAVSTPWAAITTTARIQPSQAVGVWGVGGLGAHTIQLLHTIGAAPIIALDPNGEARRRALAFGADHALDPTQPDLVEMILELTGGRGLDAAFDMAGVPAVHAQAAAALAPHASLTLVGLAPGALTIPNSFIFSSRQQHIHGHLGSAPDDVLQVLNLVRHHRLDLARSISDTLPLTDAPLGIERLRSKQGNPIRLVLTP
ncbi:zinc-binding dehydrogenase [Nocardia sp. NPDC051570]|uniref:zinc-binding dehydrogenase n=1 Tax=Nocardia sp. NPDC051570 TaxID=3364324 RepID=UPI003793BC2B